MKTSLLTLTLTFVLLQLSAQKSEEKAVLKCFDDYKSAILKGNGEEAVNYVDSKTVNYYQEVLENCKSLDSNQISQLNIMDKLMVLTVKFKTSAKDILSFNGSDLFMYAVDEEMIGKNSVKSTEIGAIEIKNDFADSKILTEGQFAPFGFEFNKEEGKWKMDLTSVFGPTIEGFSQMARDSGYSEDDYLILLLEMMSEEAELNNLWEKIEK